MYSIVVTTLRYSLSLLVYRKSTPGFQREFKCGLSLFGFCANFSQSIHKEKSWNTTVRLWWNFFMKIDVQIRNYAVVSQLTLVLCWLMRLETLETPLTWLHGRFRSAWKRWRETIWWFVEAPSSLRSTWSPLRTVSESLSERPSRKEKTVCLDDTANRMVVLIRSPLWLLCCRNQRFSDSDILERTLVTVGAMCTKKVEKYGCVNEKQNGKTFKIKR